MTLFCPNCRHSFEVDDISIVDSAAHECVACGQSFQLTEEIFAAGALSDCDLPSPVEVVEQDRGEANLPVAQAANHNSGENAVDAFGIVAKKLTLADDVVDGKAEPTSENQALVFKARKRTGTEPHLPVVKSSTAQKNAQDTSLPILKQSFSAKMSADEVDLPAPQRDGDDPTGYFVRDKTTVGEQRKKAGLSQSDDGRSRKRLLPVLLIAGIGAAGYTYWDNIHGLVANFGLVAPPKQDQAPAQTKQRLVRQAYHEYKKDTYAGYLESIRINTGLASSGEQGVVVHAKARLVQAMSAIQIRFFGSYDAEEQLKRTLYDLDQVENPGPEIIKARILSQIASGNTSAADRALKSYLKSSPKDVDAWVYTGWLGWKRQDLAASEEAYKKVLEMDPQSTAAGFGYIQLLERRAKKEDALVKLAQFLADHPQHADARLLAMTLMIGSEDIEAAKKHLESCAALDSQLSESQRFRVNHGKGMIASIEGNLPEARIIFEDQLSKRPDDPMTIAAFSDLEISAKNYDEAISLIERIPIETRRENIELTISEARARMAMGHVDAAASIIEPMHKSEPKRLDLLMAMAAVRAYQGNLRAAKLLYQSALVENDEAYDALIDYARTLLSTGQHKQALSLLRSTKPKASSLRYHLLYAEVLLALGQVSAAESAFRVLSKDNPDHDRIQYLFAKSLYKNGKFNLALERVLALQKQVPDYNGLTSLLGSIHGARGEYKRSSQLFDEALKKNPTDSLRLRASHIFVENGEFDKVLALTETVMKHTPESAESFTLRALSRLGQLSYKQAFFEIERAIRTDQSALNYTVRAQVQTKLGRPLDAIASYNKALKDDPKNPDIRFQKARLLVLNGTVRDGLRQLESILKFYPKFANAHLFAGIANEDLSSRARAKRYYQRAIQLDPELWEAHFRLGAHYLDANKGQQALYHLDQASTHAKKDDLWHVDALYYLGKAAQQIGKHSIARKTYLSFIEQAPEGDGRIASARRYIAVAR